MEARSGAVHAADSATERVTRHALAIRIYHWVMATSVLALLFTGFLPIVGVKFAWVTPHWIAGLVLCAALLFHVPRVALREGLGNMASDRRDLRIARQGVRRALRLTQEMPDKPGKYPLAQKLFHHGVALVILITVVTGLMMMAGIDTPFWRRNPYWLSDQAWGVVYVLHDLASMGVVTFVMVHIYFAIRPEKRFLTRSMIRGWISVDEYRANFDPQAWPVEGVDAAKESSARE